MRDRGPRRSFLIRAALAPASLDLKLALRRLAAGGGPVSIEGIINPAGAAWLYWLLDGVKRDARAEDRLVGRRNPEFSGRLKAGGTVPFQGRFAAPDGVGIEAVLDSDGELSLALERPDGSLPLIFPEGDGLHYAHLEERESGSSRILPDGVIDEALDFADSWR